MAVYFLCGDETFLVEEKVRALCAEQPDAEKKQFQETFKVEEVLSAQTMTGLFSSQQLILLKNPWFLSKAPTPKEIKLIEKLLEQAKESQDTLIIYQMGSVDKRKKAVTMLKKSTQMVEFNQYKDWEQDKVLAWIENRVKTYGKTIERDALIALEQVGTTNLRQLASEVEKLVTYIGNNKAITYQDVVSCSGGASGTAFQFSEALKKRNKTQIMFHAKHLLDGGEDPIKLMGLLTSNIRLYIQLLVLSDQRKSNADMGKALGKNPYFLQKVIGDVRKKYTVEHLKEVYQALSLRDMEMKSGKMKPRTALELVLASV